MATIPIPLSALPELYENTGDFYIFASKENDNGEPESCKFNLSEYLRLVAGRIQLERRIALAMERDTQIVPIGEPMTIYLAKGRNVSKLEIKANDGAVTEWTAVPLDTDIAIELTAAADIIVRVERATIESVATIYLQAKVRI